MQFQDISFKYVPYGSDFVWGFNIGDGSRYHGWSRDKQTNFHVYDENSQSYTTYETKPEFESFLASIGTGNNQTTQQTGNNINNQITWTGLPKTIYKGTNVTPLIILGSLATIYLLYTR